MASIQLPQSDRKDHLPFLKWVFATQFVPEKAELLQSVFKDVIAATLVFTYAYMVARGWDVPTGFDILLGMVMGFYFKSNRDTSLKK